jgi:hypothetical protein
MEGKYYSHYKVDFNKELAAMIKMSKYEVTFVTSFGWFESSQHIFLAMK